ncbi:MAG TPA: NUDIX hydrolase [Blastocatellia bacterium]|nr:NUDIX hydrolase [Blastocatellia bacterium]
MLDSLMPALEQCQTVRRGVLYLSPFVVLPSEAMSEADEIVAAGGVVVDREGALRVLLVHRPKYDDWSFPKGKLDPGETVEGAALREVREETGLGCRIIQRLPSLRYSYRDRRGSLRPKVVHYFLMERVEGTPTANVNEVDAVEWVEAEEARGRLTYNHDRELLDAALEEEKKREARRGGRGRD